jgi:hypothetical protein
MCLSLGVCIVTALISRATVGVGGLEIIGPTWFSEYVQHSVFSVRRVTDGDFRRLFYHFGSQEGATSFGIPMVWIAFSLISISYGIISLIFHGYRITLFGLGLLYVEEPDCRPFASWRSFPFDLLL